MIEGRRMFCDRCSKDITEPCFKVMIGQEDYCWDCFLVKVGKGEIGYRDPIRIMEDKSYAV